MSEAARENWSSGGFLRRNADSGTRGGLPEDQVYRWAGAHDSSSCCSREEAETGGISLGQKFMVSLGHIMRLCLKKKTKTSSNLLLLLISSYLNATVT